MKIMNPKMRLLQRMISSADEDDDPYESDSDKE